jgi:hypothetical protein
MRGHLSPSRSQGVEITAADIYNKDDLTKAFAGADAVFVNTVSSYQNPEDEVKLGKLLVDVAKEQKVNHFIYRYLTLFVLSVCAITNIMRSSVANAEAISKGTHKVPVFTSKALVEEYMFKLGLPSSAVQMPSYYEVCMGTVIVFALCYCGLIHYHNRIGITTAKCHVPLQKECMSLVTLSLQASFPVVLCVCVYVTRFITSFLMRLRCQMPTGLCG